VTPLAESYETTARFRFEHRHAFPEANRHNAYNTYILME
jgi:hypothetical protein